MHKDKCFELGYITKLHGLKGEVILHLDVDSPEEYQKLESVFVEINQQLVPFFIKDQQLRGNKLIVRFEDIHSIEDAESLLNSIAYLPLAFLPKLDGEHFYYHDVIDFSVITQDNESIGKVITFHTESAQPIMVVDWNDKEILIPANSEILLRADLKEKKVYVNLPDGLLNIYLEND